jgi:hypothetical protein
LIQDGKNGEKKGGLTKNKKKKKVGKCKKKRAV